MTRNTLAPRRSRCRVVGRDGADDTQGRDLNAAYRTLSDGGKERFDEYLQFLAFRDQLIATQQGR